MRRWMALALLLILFVMPAFAEEIAGTIVQSSCSIVQSGEAYMVYCFAQVHNSTEQVLCLDDSSFYLESGEETIAAEEISRLWPHFLAPGEDGYLFDVVPFEQMPQITGLNYDIRYMQLSPAYAGATLETAARVELDDGSNALSVICEIQGDPAREAYNPTVAVGLYTDAGQLVYSDGRILQDVGIPAGGKLLVRFDVKSTLVEQWMSYGALPTQVRASATFRSGSD